MTVYFYHTQDIQYILKRMEEGAFPSHFLYGATHLKDHGIDVVWHPSDISLSGWRRMVRTTWKVLTCQQHFDALYATHYTGIEPLIFLRALHLFRKPIVIWHHQPIITPKQRWREWLGRLFYRGIDEMFFFSEKLIQDSMKSTKARTERMHLAHWGADLELYDRIMQQDGTARRQGFISTGKEKRDMTTLVTAFNSTEAPLRIFLNPTNGSFSYEKLFEELYTKDNIEVNFSNRLVPYELAREVNRSACVVICCQKTKYTVGLTTVVEALALGLPIICSRNPQIPVDFEKEGCGIAVDYYDTEGWVKAIDFIRSHPEEARTMGQRGRQLAVQLYNDCHCAEEVARVLQSVME